MATSISVDDPNAVRIATECLASKGLLIYPTETAYGLGADATDPEMIDKVLRAKGRPAEKKMSDMYADINMVKQYLGTDQRLLKLIESFLPGPLTIVIHGKSVRIPNHPFCLALVKSFGKPITCTSANISGKASPYAVSGNPDLAPADLIIDAGTLPPHPLSTVYDIDSDTILREGPISHQQIKLALSNIL